MSIYTCENRTLVKNIFMKSLFIVLLLSPLFLFSQNISFQKNINFGANYYYTPLVAGNNYSVSLIYGANFDDRSFLGGGIDFSTPYDDHKLTSFFICGKKMIKRDNASPFISLRYGFGINDIREIQGTYISPSVGIIEHKEHVDINFAFSYKYIKHNYLEWIRGIEMRLGITF